MNVHVSKNLGRWKGKKMNPTDLFQEKSSWIQAGRRTFD